MVDHGNMNFTITATKFQNDNFSPISLACSTEETFLHHLNLIVKKYISDLVVVNESTITACRERVNISLNHSTRQAFVHIAKQRFPDGISLISKQLL